jgi:RNA polymerase primary sigma factor
MSVNLQIPTREQYLRETGMRRLPRDSHASILNSDPYSTSLFFYDPRIRANGKPGKPERIVLYSGTARSIKRLVLDSRKSIDEEHCQAELSDIIDGLSNGGGNLVLGSRAASSIVINTYIPNSYVNHDSFHKQGFEKSFLANYHRILNEYTAYFNPQSIFDAETPPKKRKRLSIHQEKELFLAYNGARFLLQNAIAKIGRGDYHARDLQEIAQYTKIADDLESCIVNNNLPLVVSMANKTNIIGVTPDELISEGSMALLNSVKKFDVSRGFKFSTYACRSILKAFNRLATTTVKYDKYNHVPYDPELETGDMVSIRDSEQREFAVSTVKEILDNNIAGLTPREKQLIVERYCLPGSVTKNPTLKEIGNKLGITHERVRQISKTAMNKIRASLEYYL